MSLTPQIVALLVLDVIFIFFGLIAFFLSVKIALLWNAKATTPLQYKLYQQSYLVAVIIKYLFVLKLPLFLFFIFTCDTLSSIITGAMCASGVVNSVDFGLNLTLFKLVNLYLFGFWLLLHHADMKEETQPFTKLKFFLFTLFAIPLFVEIFLEIDFFTSLNISKIVSCCGTLFSAASTSSVSLLFLVNANVWMLLFYASFAVVIVAYKVKNTPLLILSNIFLCFFAIVSLILFFSPYVYELPTHHCPFCLLQSDYFYVGYGLYTLLFIGTFYGICGGILDVMRHTKTKRFFDISLVVNALYVISISAYPLSYYMRNGVWL